MRWYAAGHNAVYSADGKDYFVCHAYDISAKGQSRLILAEVRWVDGWPVMDAGAVVAAKTGWRRGLNWR